MGIRLAEFAYLFWFAGEMKKAKYKSMSETQYSKWESQEEAGQRLRIFVGSAGRQPNSLSPIFFGDVFVSSLQRRKSIIEGNPSFCRCEWRRITVNMIWYYTTGPKIAKILEEDLRHCQHIQIPGNLSYAETGRLMAAKCLCIRDMTDILVWRREIFVVSAIQENNFLRI